VVELPRQHLPYAYPRQAGEDQTQVVQGAHRQGLRCQLRALNLDREWQRETLRECLLKFLEPATVLRTVDCKRHAPCLENLPMDRLACILHQHATEILHNMAGLLGIDHWPHQETWHAQVQQGVSLENDLRR